MTTSEESPVLARLQGATHLEDYAHNVVRPSEYFEAWRRVNRDFNRGTFYLDLGTALGVVTLKERAAEYPGQCRWSAEIAFEVYDDAE